jgi:hypothetical protein
MSKSSLRITLTALAVGSVLALGAGGAQAFTWNLSSPSGLLGTTQTYTAGGFTITAAGFAADFMHPTALFGKAAGGDENGLGLANDPTGDNEITGMNFIRVAMPTGVSNVSFIMDSVTGNDTWDVFGGATATGAFSILTMGNDELVSHPLPFANFYIFEATNGNVLVASISASAVPEPSTWAMMLLGFLGLGFAFRQSRRKVSFA